MRVKTVICEIQLLWWMMKILPIWMRKKTRVNSWESIGNRNLGGKWDIIKKYRYHQRLIIIMKLMDQNLMWQIDSTVSSSSHLNILQWIGVFKDFLLREICIHGDTRQEGSHIIPWTQIDQHNCWWNNNIIWNHAADINWSLEDGRISVLLCGGSYDSLMS